MNRSFLQGKTVISSRPDAVTVSSDLLKQKCRLTLIGDYHAVTDDERGVPFAQYSARMAQYGHADMKELEELFAQACQNGSDAVILLGDIISFPSEKGVELLSSMMKNSPIPVYFTAGNHDWHYEGTPGSDKKLRQEWIRKRLLPLYDGRDPMNYAVEIKGIKLLMVDNSVYETTTSQLEFLRRELSEDKPALLGVHIPFYLGMPFHTAGNYGCGHPQWGAEADRYYGIERRERWAAEGLSAESFEFCREALRSRNLLGILAGHVHTFGLDTWENKFQVAVSSLHSTTLTLSGN